MCARTCTQSAPMCAHMIRVYVPIADIHMHFIPVNQHKCHEAGRCASRGQENQRSHQSGVLC